MDLEDITQRRNRLETKAHEKIQDALNDMRDELGKSNEYVAQQLNGIKEPEPEIPVTPVTPKPKEPSTPISQVSKKPLVYFSYPMTGYSEQPVWADPLRKVLIQNGYLVYNPWDNIDAQFGQQDLPYLNAMPTRIVKSLCSLLCIPEETLLPFESVWNLIQKGDEGDNYAIVFQCLWFLVRSSLVVCDLMRPMAGAGVAQELLYSKQMGIPVVGLFPTTGQINPFVHRSTTVLFSGNDLLALLPLVKGYAPN